MSFQELVVEGLTGKRPSRRSTVSRCESCAEDRLTLGLAYDYVNHGALLCSSCAELAWRLIAADLDANGVGPDSPVTA